jgi:hypothetical protein
MLTLCDSVAASPWRLVVAAVVLVAGGSPAGGVNAKGEEMTYGEAREFLAGHTSVIELAGEDGARVAICPEWQGRVMTSTCGGMEGPSFGFINGKFIEAAESDPRFNNYGGEDRMWLSPEGGKFSLWFKPGAAQTLDNWYTPPAMNQGAYQQTSGPTDPYYRLTHRMALQNASATEFDLGVTRDARLLSKTDLEELFGDAAARMTQDGVKMVAYETVNTITNRGPALTVEKGLVSIWILGMLNSGPETVVVVPYRPGDESGLGPPVKSDYFGPVPPQRLKVTPEAILFRADGNYRAKIGTSQRRARNVLGSMDFAAGVLTLVHFSMPDDPAGCRYMNNMWGLPTPDPYSGDVANSYNDGPPEPGTAGLGPFYEIESLSPAVVLDRGRTLEHHHRTLHIQASPAILDAIAKSVLGVGWEAVRSEMFSH